MIASVATFLSQVRERGAEIPEALSGALLLAAVRASDLRATAVRPEKLEVDADGIVHMPASQPDPGSPYAAPELKDGVAPPRDPRVLVYAAGVLGYELVTLKPPADGLDPLLLRGALAPVIRKAVSADRRKRYRNLTELAQAIAEVQPPPSREEERLILAALAQSGVAPKKLAKVELQRPSSPAATEAPAGAAQVHPLFAQRWDPLEAPPDGFFAPQHGEEAAPAEAAPAAEQVAPPAERPAAEEPGVIELREVEVREAHSSAPPPDAVRQLRDEMVLLESRLENLARLGARIPALEKRLEASLPPAPRNDAAALARQVKALLDERRFAEAERALDTPLAQGDAVLQLRLGQAIAGQSDLDGSRDARAELAFHRAAELDTGWAEPRVQLGALLLRQGKRSQAAALFRAALAIDPACAEAQAALGQLPRVRGSALPALGGAAAGAAVAVAAVLLLRASPKPAAAPAPVVQAAAVVPVPAPPPPKPAPVETKAEPKPEAGPEPKREPKAEPPPEPKREADPPQKPEPRARREVRKPARTDPAAASDVAQGDKALRAFDTAAALAAFQSALKADPQYPQAHRGLGMVYVLQGRNAEAKAEYRRYLQLQPDAPDAEQIKRLLAR